MALAGAMDGQYRLRVKDFGPIRDAEVEIRPLTVFVGPSNTGKSYLAGLLYALHRTFRGTRDSGAYAVPVQHAWIPHNLSDELGRKINSWLADLDTGGPELSVPAFLASCFHEILNGPSDFGPVLAEEVARCFGVEDTASLIRHRSHSRAPSLELLVPYAGRDGARFSTTLGLDGQPPFVDITKARLNVPSRRLEEFRFDARFARLAGIERFRPGLVLDVGDLTNIAFGSAFEPLVQHGAYYLPADRASYGRKWCTDELSRAACLC